MRGTRFIAGTAAVCAVTVLAACQDDTLTNAGPDGSFGAPQLSVSGGDDPAVQLANYMEAVNAALAASGAGYQAVMAEAITTAESGEVGITVLAKDVGNKQLGFDFVPNDGRRGWSSAGGNAITYAIDQTGDAVPPFGGLGAVQTDAAIVRGHNSWEALSCSSLGQSRNPDFGLDIGVVAFQFSGGAVGSPFVFADVQHAGWRDLNFGGGVLGVTFTFGFTGGTCSGIFTDIDGNGKCDTAFREIYYDPSFNWFDDGQNNVDVESIAVHEIGHGLSQAHFGSVVFKNDGSLARSPFAVMNAIYSQPLQALQGTDIGGHCSNWAEWPNN